MATPLTPNDVFQGISVARSLCAETIASLKDVIFHKLALQKNTDQENRLLADAQQQESDYDAILNNLSATTVSTTAVSQADIDAVNGFLIQVQNYALADAVAEGGLTLFQKALNAADNLVTHATTS